MLEPAPLSDSPSYFVTTIKLELADKLRQGLEERGFLLSQPTYTLFSGKKKGVTCTLYQSGKLMVQGKEMREFIEFYLEPEILGSVSFTHHRALLDRTPRIGVDESGKGDFFGPLCIASLYAGDEGVLQLDKMGVRDSKTLSDDKVLKLAQLIKKDYPYAIIRITPQKYNELYQQFHNLNSLLAWGHATAIESLSIKTGCTFIVIDQFAAKYVVETALKRKQVQVTLTQQHRAESDVVVAGASILARAAFLEGLESLGKIYEVTLPKGASAGTIRVGKTLVKNFGKEILLDVAKVHFKTYLSVVGSDATDTSIAETEGL